MTRFSENIASDLILKMQEPMSESCFFRDFASFFTEPVEFGVEDVKAIREMLRTITQNSRFTFISLFSNEQTKTTGKKVTVDLLPNSCSLPSKEKSELFLKRFEEYAIEFPFKYFTLLRCQARNSVKPCESFYVNLAENIQLL